MATTLNQTHPLLTIPFNADSDFTVLADHCHQLAEAQAESLDPALRMALCGRFSAVFALLKPQLNEPIPPEQQDRFTVDTLPTHVPQFAPDSDTLGEYCAALAQVLLCRSVPPTTGRTAALAAGRFDGVSGRGDQRAALDPHGERGERY
jgi:hypothetical protein